MTEAPKRGEIVKKFGQAWLSEERQQISAWLEVNAVTKAQSTEVSEKKPKRQRPNSVRAKQSAHLARKKIAQGKKDAAAKSEKMAKKRREEMAKVTLGNESE